jgi:acyl carrier protein
MSLLTELEDRFDVELPSAVASQLRTLNDIVEHFRAEEESS